MPQETHHIPQKRNKQDIFLHNYFKNLTENLILPGKMSILCDPDPKIVQKYRATRNF